MPNASPVIRILFVCTGNICRSPTAEGVFRHLVEAEGLSDRFQIDSAGTDSYHAGQGPDKRAVKIAKKHGVDIGHQKARALKEADYAAYDYIFAMDGGHFHELQARAPGKVSAKIEMFLSAATHLDRQEVPDPWYGNEKDFEDVYALVRTGAEALLKKIRQEHQL
jgi:protein-tyrosine phosphatase